MSINLLKHKHPILFYDGYCYLCSNTIQLLIRLDRKKKIRFMSLQKGLKTPYIKQLISTYTIEDSIILLSEERIYTKSNAIIKIIKTLGGGFRLIVLFYIFPNSLRNYIYDLVARNRYSIFGKRDKCHHPKAEFTDRFL